MPSLIIVRTLGVATVPKKGAFSLSINGTADSATSPPPPPPLPQEPDADRPGAVLAGVGVAGGSAAGALCVPLSPTSGQLVAQLWRGPGAPAQLHPASSEGAGFQLAN